MEREQDVSRIEPSNVDRVGAARLLLRACDLAEQGLFAKARADIDAAIDVGCGDPTIEIAAGLLLFTTRDYQRALDQFACAAARSPEAARPARRFAISAAAV